MRGKANIGRSFLHVRGITPAYAGKRMETMTRRHAVGDHPRVCGEKVDLARMPASKPGSPPRMRGKGIVLVCVGHVHGITPAYAGKSYRLLKVFVSKPGSPPRMRGKDFWHYADNYATGITPAYAGKSAQLEGASPLAQDHPRVCGEKRDFSRLPPFLQGSPPRMRGKVPTFHPPSGAVGITPAYAGKRRLCVVAAHLGRDHPRVCGEKNIWVVDAITSTGSPPRMRGKVRIKPLTRFGFRITPAYAGKR